MRKKIKWAIVGLGSQAERIAEAIHVSRNSVLTAAADISAKRVKEFAGNFNVGESFNTFDKLLTNSGANAVFIASPNYLHAAQSISALNAKKHVLCEKPMCLSLKEALSVKKAVKKNNVKFGVGFHLRFHPVLREVKKIIQSGKTGEVVFAEMHWSIGDAGETKMTALPGHKLWRENMSQSGGGSLMARGVHLFDLLRFILGRDIDDACSLSDRRSKNSVDQLTAGVMRAGDIFATIATSRKIPFSLNRIIIYGSRGRLLAPESFNTDGTGILEVNIMGKKSVKKFTKKTNLYKEEIENFSDAILKNKKWFGADINDGLKSVRATEAWSKFTQSI